MATSTTSTMWQEARGACILIFAAALWSVLLAVLLANYFGYAAAFNTLADSVRGGQLSWESAKSMLRVHDVLVYVLSAALAYPVAVLLYRITRRTRAAVAVASLAVGTSLIWSWYLVSSILGEYGAVANPRSVGNWLQVFFSLLAIAALPLFYLLVGRRNVAAGRVKTNT